MRLKTVSITILEGRKATIRLTIHVTIVFDTQTNDLECSLLYIDGSSCRFGICRVFENLESWLGKQSMVGNLQYIATLMELIIRFHTR